MLLGAAKSWKHEAHPNVAVTPESAQENFQSSWGKRLQALKNIPPVLRIIWDSSPAVVSAELALRAIVAVVPLGLLAVTRLIIDAVVAHVARGEALRPHFWWLVGA